MRIEQYQCDACGLLKGATNGWWMAWPHAGAMTLEHFRASDAVEVKHLCGEGCVHKLVGEFLSGKKVFDV